MLSPYTFASYKVLMKAFIQARKKADPSFSHTLLAETIQVQRSYLSRVLNGDADLSSDQVYLFSEAFQLTDDERDYLMLLHETDRCGIEARRKNLAAKRDRIREKALSSGRSLAREEINPTHESFVEYYSDPLIPLVHMFLTIPKFAAEPGRIEAEIGVSEGQVRAALQTLERCGVIVKDKKGYRVEKESLHLDPNSTLYRNFATHFRLKALQYLQQQKDDQNYFFTASFSANDVLRTEIRKRFLELLKWIGEEVASGHATSVYHLNFDLLKI